MWTDKYEIVGIVPGRIVTKLGKEVDLSDKSLPVALLDDIYASGSAYLKLKRPKQANSNKEEA